MRKFVLVTLALVLALGALGVGYASWTDKVTVSGPISTGKVEWCFTKVLGSRDELVDPAPPYLPPDPRADTVYPWLTGNKDWHLPTFTWHGNFGDMFQGDKDVGWTTVEWEDCHNVQVTLNNVYPSYANEITVHEINKGTIPVRLYLPTLTYPDQNGNPVTVPFPKSPVTAIWGWDKDGNWNRVMEAQWVDNLDALVEPDEIVEDSFFIHVLQPAKQSFTYSFTVSRAVVQWDEWQ